jgi:hypothetical protein
VAQEHMPPQIAVTPSSMSRNGSINTPASGAWTCNSTPSRLTTRSIGMNHSMGLFRAR